MQRWSHRDAALALQAGRSAKGGREDRGFRGVSFELHFSLGLLTLQRGGQPGGPLA
jgi:hypothetical protein